MKALMELEDSNRFPIVADQNYMPFDKAYIALGSITVNFRKFYTRKKWK